MNRLHFTDHEKSGSLHLVFALLLMIAGIALIIAGFDCWPRLVFGLVSWLAGMAIIADLIQKKRIINSKYGYGPGGIRITPNYLDDLTNRLYSELTGVWENCPSCNKLAGMIECSESRGVDCPDCGPVWFDLFKEGFYGENRLIKEG